MWGSNPAQSFIMSPLADRIAQFRKMATDDPEKRNSGTSASGQLLMDDGQFAEASHGRSPPHTGPQPVVLEGVPTARRVSPEARRGRPRRCRC